MITKKLRIVSFCLVILTVLASGAYAAPMTSNTTTMPQSYSTGSFGSNEVMPGKSPTTGLDWEGEYRPVLVQVSNAKEARPHWNFSEADIVYESIVWGPAHTRYTAVFSDNHPDLVGSVRSARVNHCEIRQEWDCPLVFWGGQQAEGSSIYDFFKVNKVDKGFLFDGTRNNAASKALGRDSTRVSPHNAVANLAMAVETAWPKDDKGNPYTPKSHAFKFSTTPTAGGDSAQEIYVVYDEKEYFPSYTFNKEERVYERWYCGEEQYDGKTNKRIVASNVIVQFCNTNYYQNAASRPIIEMLGGGVMDAFIDGRHIRGTWTRKGMNDRTVFQDMNGEEITLLPGKTFIQVIPTSSSFTYVREDGQEITMDNGTKVEAAEIVESNIEELNKME